MEYPWWLLGLCLPALLWWFPRAQLRDEYWERLKPYADKDLMPYLVIQQRHTKQGIRQRFLLWTALWCLAIIALADPRWGFTEIDVFQPGSNVVILLDMSWSMQANDVKPSRFIRARQEIRDFVTQGETLRIGLVAFASIAHVITPLTNDNATLLHQLNVLSPNMLKIRGSQVENALLTAQRLLESQPVGDGDQAFILLVSDGDFDEPGLEKTITSLREQGTMTYTLGVGKKQGISLADERGHWIVDKQGKRVITALQEEVLSYVAKVGGGEYARASYKESDTQALLRSMTKKTALKQVDTPIRVWNDQYYWLVLLMLPLVLFRFRRVQAKWKQ